MRVAASGTPHRATADVEFVTVYAEPNPDLDGLDDHDRLFVAGHRWAFDGAQPARLRSGHSKPVSIRVATPAGLVAAKSHAVGFPSRARRATKYGSDLLDIFRLVDLCNVGGSLIEQLHTGPAGLARIIADVAAREILMNPASAVNQMRFASPVPIEVERVTDSIGAFVDDLRG